MRALVAIAVLLVATEAAAGAVTAEVAGVTVDWSAGELSCSRAAAADLRAPTAALARVGAERRARERAAAALLAAARKLPLASGKTLGDAMERDAELTARVTAALSRTRDLALDYGSDGSTRATVAAPIEGIRAALQGVARGGPPADAPTALVIEVARAFDGPRLGVTLGAGTERYTGPTIYLVRDVPVASSEPRLGARVVRGKGTRFTDGVLAVEGAAAAALPAARASDALVVLVLAGDYTKKEPGGRASERAGKKKGRAR